HFDIDKKNIQIVGESFNSTLTWDKTYGVTENKTYFFIWQQKNSANIIPKHFLTDEKIDFLRKTGSIYKRKQ
ncbi:YcxB family protein, partial [Dysgonomonas sp. OttesenSCG-928-M03]|nr:YcxB family protein [Dysgonomonas sp. OttesenSCG-928-M03]